MAISTNAVYEIRPAAGTEGCVTIPGAGTTNGVPAVVAPETSARRQMFKFEATGAADEYRIKSIYAKRYLDVPAGAESGAEVENWTESTSRAQAWTVKASGDPVTIAGDTCEGYTITLSGTSHQMDALAGGSVPYGYLHIYDGGASVWYLREVTELSEALPTPYNVGLREEGGGDPQTEFESYGTAPVVAWDAPASATAFEWRYRVRYMTLSGEWGAFGDWSAWAATESRHGDAIACSYDWAISIEAQVEAQARVRDGATVSRSADAVISVFQKPKITAVVIYSPDGVTISGRSKYAGTSLLTAYAIYNDAGENLLTGPVSLSFVKSGEVTVSPVDLAPAFDLTMGSKTAVIYPGYDKHLRFARALTSADIRKAEIGGSGTTTDHLRLTHDGVREYVDVTAAATVSSVWTEFGGKRVPAIDRGNGRYELQYPGDKSKFDVYAAADHMMTVSANGHHITYQWSTGSKMLYLHHFTEIPVHSYQIDASNDEAVYDGHRHSTVTFAGDARTTITATGVLMPDDETKAEDIEALAGTHAAFSDIRGGIHNVAVTSVSVSKRYNLTEVSVSMTEED